MNKSCPWCGQPPQTRNGCLNEVFIGIIECSCSVRTSLVRFGRTQEEADAEAQKAWNTRIEDEKIEKLRKGLQVIMQWDMFSLSDEKLREFVNDLPWLRRHIKSMLSLIEQEKS